MDFLDSLDINSSYQKCNRVRSWYLYEQYKSLEKNQLDATKRLKNKAYQKRVLKQELNDRRARRRLCDHIGMSQSEYGLENIHSIHSNAYLSASDDDDFIQSFNEFEINSQHEYEINPEHEFEINPQPNFIPDSDISKNYYNEHNETYKSGDGDSQDSVLENAIDDVKEELDFVKNNIAENITLQLETVKENMEFLEKYSKFNHVENIKTTDSFYGNSKSDHCSLTRDKLNGSKDNRVLSLWSKLVAFAFTIIRLNQGMITVITTAVPNFLLVSWCAMFFDEAFVTCPYVSPVKFAASESDISLHSHKLEKRKNMKTLKKCSKPINGTKLHIYNKINFPKNCHSLDRKYHSESKWPHHSKLSSNNNYRNKIKYRGVSEPWCSANKCRSKELTNKWPDTFVKCQLSEENLSKCPCIKRVMYPILQMAQYVDSILQDIDDGH